jgi:hypothetical protein
MNEVSLEALRARERNLEEEWIAKYRAALQSIPMRETWDDRVHKIAYKVYGSVATSARGVPGKILSSKLVARWIQLMPSRLRTTVVPTTVKSPPPLSAVRTIPAPAKAPRKSKSVAVRVQSAKKAG